jgi:hypothetical protein
MNETEGIIFLYWCYEISQEVIGLPLYAETGLVGMNTAMVNQTIFFLIV